MEEKQRRRVITVRLWSRVVLFETDTRAIIPFYWGLFYRKTDRSSRGTWLGDRIHARMTDLPACLYVCLSGGIRPSPQPQKSQSNK